MMDEVSKKALNNKLTAKLYKHTLSHEMDVASFLYDYIEIFIKSVIHQIARCRKKYDIICPLLKPVENDDEKEKNAGTDKSYLKTKVTFCDDPITMKDLYECFKACPHIIQKRNIYHVYLKSILTRINEEKRPKKIKFCGESLPTFEM